MDTLTLVWIVTVVAALVTGACFVGVLVVRRSLEPIVALLGISAFGFSAYSVVVISTAYYRIDAGLYAFAFLVAGIVGGWAIAASLLERFIKLPSPLTLEQEMATTGDKGTAVVVVSCLEPAEYDPSITAGMLQSLADEELLDPSMTVLPFLFFAQKARYRAVGGTSPAEGELRQLAEAIELSLGSAVGRVDTATCSGEQRLATRVKDAIDAGFEKVVVAEIVIAESLHLSTAKRETDALRPDLVGRRVAYTSTLGGSERLVNMLVARVLASAETTDNSGVVLVGHGQPEARARRNQGFDEDETAFLSRIRMRLVDEGIPETHIRIAWAEWNSPDVTSSVRHLAALGCRRVVVLPAVFAFDTIGTRLDLELAVRQARVDDTVAVVTLSAWRDDPIVVSEIAQRVQAEIAG
ncbi:MAG TPA: ferrochelatase [Coriobacteriia bacterium]|nr:ferrochelatase [Coriobacteriia bacterium]